GNPSNQSTNARANAAQTATKTTNPSALHSGDLRRYRDPDAFRSARMKLIRAHERDIRSGRPLLPQPPTPNGSRGRVVPTRGHTSDALSPQIIDGANANITDWPWIVSLQDTDGGDPFHVCGGSLIDPEWVLSAAHCFSLPMPFNPDQVVLGVDAL